MTFVTQTTEEIEMISNMIFVINSEPSLRTMYFDKYPSWSFNWTFITEEGNNVIERDRSSLGIY